jgi:O-methyltransferase
MSIPDSGFYRPLFNPWIGFGDFPLYFSRTVGRTLVSADRCYMLYSLAKQALTLGGEFWECGVYKGGTAALLAEIITRAAPADSIRKRRLRLFDTFAGMPETDPEKDRFRQGDFGDVSFNEVRAAVGNADFISYHKGLIPETFKGLERSRIVFAHIDVDIYKSIMDCCEFIFPRLKAGGFMVFDDYGFPSCPGARQAVDEYFMETDAVPLVLPTGQALVFKSN